MPRDSFVHLHLHTEYSLLDGAIRIRELMEKAKKFGMPAVAITDHGNLHAAWELQEQAKKAKLKPIIGMEAYVAPGDRRVKGRATPGAKPYYHLVLLARDMAGYNNLVKLSSLAYTEGFYTKPRVDRELLARYSEGLIVSSACLAGEIATKLETGDEAGAREAASWYADVFKDRLDRSYDRCEILHQVVGQRVDRAVGDKGAPVAAHDRVAVGRGARDPPEPDCAAGPAQVLDHNRLAENGMQPFGEHARQHIGCPARRERDHDRDRPRRIGLRMRSAGRGEAKDERSERARDASMRARAHGLLDLHAGGFHHLAPADALGLGIIGEFVRSGG